MMQAFASLYSHGFGSLSPRGDWRAPADAGAAVWLAELAENVPET
jgi:NAD+ synthase (glutamine-hydrolysing)